MRPSERFKMARLRQENSFMKKGAAVVASLGAAFVFAGFYHGDQRMVEETYIVQKGDTLWHISEEFMKKNTGGNRYILEFKQGIIENNESLQNGKSGCIQPGQKLRITYWVKDDGK